MQKFDAGASVIYFGVWRMTVWAHFGSMNGSPIRLESLGRFQCCHYNAQVITRCKFGSGGSIGLHGVPHTHTHIYTCKMKAMVGGIVRNVEPFNSSH